MHRTRALAQTASSAITLMIGMLRNVRILAMGNAGITFLRAAPWPCLTGLASLICSLLLWQLAAGLLAEGHLLSGAALICPALGWAALAGICWLDAYARHRDYHRIRAMLAKYGFRPRVFDLVAASRCQRDAALHAARVTGHDGHARSHFRALGYRWYHLLPDPVVDNPFNFFNIAFLRQAFLPGKSLRTSTD